MVREKVKKPRSNLASMGVYIFKKELLYSWLKTTTDHDFGNHIFPKMVSKARIFTYAFEGYWRDIGTVASYWQTNMDMISMPLSFLYDAKWTIHTQETEKPPSRISETANVVDCLLSSGCAIEGHVEHSVLSPGVRIARGAVVRDSVIMHGAVIGRDSVVERAILDEGVTIGEGCNIGYGSDYQTSRQRPRITTSGLTLISKNTKIRSGVTIGRNLIV